MGLGLLEISNCNRNVPILVKTRGQPTSDDIPLARYDIFHVLLIFQPVFQPKWLFLKVIMGLRQFDFSNCNRNVPIVVKMRGQPTSDDLSLVRYDIFLILLRFQSVFQPKWVFLKVLVGLRQFDISNCNRNVRFWLKRGVNQLLMTYRWRDMTFFLYY